MFVLALALAFVLTAVFALVTGDYYGSAMFGALAAVLYSSVRVGRLAWQSGYLAARSAMYRSLAESQKRGLTPFDWLIGEAERDGIEITVERDDDG